MSAIKRTLFMLSALFALLVSVASTDHAQNLSLVNYTETKLVVPDLTGVGLGYTVAVSGNTAVVGAPHVDPSIQSVYVFTRSDSGWTQQAKLTPSDGIPDQLFGSSVAIDKDTIIVGARGFDTENSFVPASVYVYVRSGSVWVEQTKITQPGGLSRYTGFGESIAISGDTLAISEIYREWTDSPVYVYVRSGSTWTLQRTLTSPTADVESSRLLFGGSLALEGDTLAVGTPEEDDEAAGLMNSGSVFVFVRSGSTWTLQEKLTASDAKDSDFFGYSVAISGDDLIVGSPIGHYERPGAAYVFTRSGSKWTEQPKLMASDSAAANLFGLSVAINGDRLIVGAPSTYRSDEPKLDSAYIFARSGGGWLEQKKLIPLDSVNGDRFGLSVAISADAILVGKPPASQTGYTGGAAYVYEEKQGDVTPPQISGLNNLNVTAVSTAGAVATFSPTATDDVDGSVPVTCSPASGSTFPLGTTTVQCEATDQAGNTAAGGFTVTVTYSWSGFLQPVTEDGSSVFKLGSTVPVKFQLTGASSGVQGAAAKFSYVKLSSLVAGTAMQPSSTAAPTSGNLFRYDAGKGQYIYNWGTKGLTAGTYQLRIDLGDGASHTVKVSLK